MAITTSTTNHAPPEACPSCGAALAADQRYCLNCGARPGSPRLSPDEVAAWAASDGAAAAPPSAAPAAAAVAPAAAVQRDWMPLIALGGLATLALVLVVGVLIGKTSSGGKGGGAAQIVTVAGGGAPSTPAGGAGSGGTATASFTGDWDSTKDGWTIEIGSLPKSGNQPAAVAAAKTAASGKGLAAVGALDSDSFPSLPGGQYVIYSGSYDSKKAADAALAKAKAAYPGAKVVHVSQTAGGGSGGSDGGGGGSSSSSGGSQAPDLSKSTGSNYEKQSQSSPKTQSLPGKPPAKDNKKAGDGTAVQSIG